MKNNYDYNNADESIEYTADSEFNTEKTDIYEKNDNDENAGVYVHEFREPYEYEGKKYKTLNFYFKNLTGQDMIDVEREMSDNNEFAIAPEFSSSYLLKTAAKAAGISSGAMVKMPINEAAKIRGRTRGFLLSRE